MTTKKITVLLIDDHPVVRAGFVRLLSTDENITVVGEASSGDELCRLYEEKHPDVVVLDLAMPGIGGLAAARRLLGKDSAAKILVFSIHNNEAMLSRALKAGVSGYLTKQSAPAVLLEAVKAVAKGKMFIDPELFGRALNNRQEGLLDRLTAREFEVFTMLAEGHSINKIAEILSISPKTAGVHQTRIMNKLEVKNAVQLVRLALKQGVISP